MSLKEMLVARFGPLMTYSDMAALFGLGSSAAADAMRQRMRRDKALGAQLRSCSVRLGRKTYFRADLVAAAIGELASTASPLHRQSATQAPEDSEVGSGSPMPPAPVLEGGK